MADDDGTQSQQPLPLDDSAVHKAEERARKAEQRAREAERKAKERDDAEAKKKRDADIQSAEDAKRALAEVEKREAEALARLKSFEAREQARVDAMLEKLPKDQRERVEKYRGRLGDDFSSFISEELERVAPKPQDDEAGGGGVDVGNSADATKLGDPPPPANPGGVMRRTKTDGRRIEPWAKQQLDRMGVDTKAAEVSLQVQRDGGSSKFIFPPEKMRGFMKERAMKPALLSQDEYEKLHSR